MIFEKKRLNILIIEDNTQDYILTDSYLSAKFKNYKVVHAESSKSAITELKKSNKRAFDVILLDLSLPDNEGIKLIKLIQAQAPYTPIIILTGYSDLNAVIDAINKGEVYRYLTKPWDPDTIRHTIEKAYEVFDLREENKVLTEKLKEANEQLEFLLRQNLIS